MELDEQPMFLYPVVAKFGKAPDLGSGNCACSSRVYRTKPWKMQTSATGYKRKEKLVHAWVVQLVERTVHTRYAGGSSPPPGTRPTR